MPRGGASGGSRGGKNSPRYKPRANKSEDDRETTISRAMSFVLRHGAEKEGLRVDGRGYVNVADLLSWHRLTILNVTFAELQSIVETNAKQRFALIPAPDPTASTPGSSASHDPLNPAHFLIRATQGHSFSVASENIHTPILITDPDCPDHVVHGTFDPKWKLILKSGGLKPMGRQHVHFALGLPSGGVTLPLRLFPSSALKEVQTGIEPDAGQNAGSISAAADDITLAPPAPASSSELVISGMRATASMLVWVDVKRSLEAGALKWWRSANGVVLTEGDAEGKVGLEWVNRVEKRNGEVVWRGESLGKA